MNRGKDMRGMIGAVILMLAGCTTGGWDKPGASENDFITDRGDCVSRAFAAPTAFQQNMILTGCMQSKGWRWNQTPVQATNAPTKQPWE